MKTFITQTPFQPEKLSGLHQVEEDKDLTWLNATTKQGFKIEGVSAGIVFVVYHRGTLVACQHWCNIPSSTAVSETVVKSVDDKFKYLTSALRAKFLNLSHFTVYALGGQESSQNLMDELRMRARNQSLPFAFNIDSLHLVHGEDTFDLIVRKGNPSFQAMHLKADEHTQQTPAVASKNEHAQQTHAATNARGKKRHY